MPTAMLTTLLTPNANPHRIPIGAKMIAHSTSTIAMPTDSTLSRTKILSLEVNSPNCAEKDQDPDDYCCRDDASGDIEGPGGCLMLHFLTTNSHCNDSLPTKQTVCDGVHQHLDSAVGGKGEDESSEDHAV